MIEKTITIENKLGLHARPSALFVEKASHFASNITLIKDGLEVNGKSIMGVLMLAAEFGSQITLRIDGEDENEMLAALTDLLKGKFNED